ncbi:hypothetical protein [Lentibacillus sp.]|nr:hypothetical protein [Lentibacillus sp.]HLS09750.1 hypothetical protein [Lentibacillus sp.]
MVTYFNYIIRNRMIDLMRKQNKEVEKTTQFAQDIKRTLMTAIIIGIMD